MASKQNMGFAEDNFGKKVDKCLTDTVLKSFGGLLIGTMLSLTLFKRRTWPITVGTGFGLGIAYRTCERDLNSK